MRVYHDQDANLNALEGRRIALIGYGNQGRAQALNLRDSGLPVIVGNREDGYAVRAREDGFSPLPIARAAAEAEVVMMLLPDEVAPAVFDKEIAPHLSAGDALVFASGYNVAFGFITPPSFVDVVLVAPRMIGAGVREQFVTGRGFPSFIGVAQDFTGHGKEIALALARGIGSTRAGVVEVTFAQEAELDLFTEQCFGPAFGHVLTTAVDLLLEEGYPPGAVLLELYMSGELSYTLGAIAELGMIEQSTLHSNTSQYGSMSRGMRFMLPELRAKMREGLEEIRSGRFAREWAAEQEAGCPTLEGLREAARSLSLYQLEQELRRALGRERLPPAARSSIPQWEQADPAGPNQPGGAGRSGRRWTRLRRLWSRWRRKTESRSPADALSTTQMECVLLKFVAHATHDPALQDYARSQQVTTHYVLSDVALQFYICFRDGRVTGDVGPPPSAAEVCLEMEADVLDGMFSGRVNAMRAAMTGKLRFGGDTRLAMGIQRIQKDLNKLYRLARKEAMAEEE